MAGNDSKYIATMKAKKTVDSSGALYDSFTEYRFGELLELAGCQYQHNEITLSSPKDNGGRYTPDYIIQRNIKGLPFIDAYDTKGKAFEEDQYAQDVASLMLKLMGVSQYGAIIRSFCLVYQNGIRYYDIETTDIFKPKQAAFYKCPTCGKFEVLPTNAHKCSYCGTVSKQYCTAGGWNDFVARNADKETLPHRTSWEHRAIERLRELAELANIAILNDEDVWQVAYPDRRDIMWRPDLAYEILADKIKTMGTVSKPQSFISCIEDETAYAHMMDYLAWHASNKESVITQAVFATPKGIKVAEWNNKQLRPGGAYRCKECGKGYFAADADTKCPYCLKDNAEKVVTKRNGGQR